MAMPGPMPPPAPPPGGMPIGGGIDPMLLMAMMGGAGGNPMNMQNAAIPPDQVAQMRQLLALLGGLGGANTTVPGQPMPNPRSSAMQPVLGGIPGG